MDKRPINLNLLTIRFPLTAWVSILHRISGLVLLLFIPYLLWILNRSLSSSDNFHDLYMQFTHPFITLVLGLGCAGLVFHLIAGIRHVLMDNHIGASKRGGWIGAMLVFFVTILVIALSLLLIR